MHVRIAWEIYNHQQKYQMDPKSVCSSVMASSNPKMETLRQSQILADPNHSMFRPPQQPSQHQYPHTHSHSHSHPHVHVQSNNHHVLSQQQPQPPAPPPTSNSNSTSSNNGLNSHELPFSTALRKFESQSIPVSSSNGFHTSSVVNSGESLFILLFFQKSHIIKNLFGL